MRTPLSLMALIGFVAVAPAQEPPRPMTDKEPVYAPAPPSVAMAKAAGNGMKVTVEVRVTKQVTYTENVEVLEKVDGKDVKKLVGVQKTRSVSMSDPRVLLLGGDGTSVINVEGKPVKPEDAIKRLEKQTPILISYGGPPQPFYLQTTKPDTLILILPLATPQPIGPTLPK